MKKLLIAMIRFYRRYISPLSPPSCRYSPTCSQYGIEAIERFGAVKGTGMTLLRILRCNPWSAGGYDPVPEVKQRASASKKGKFKTIRYKENKDIEKK